MTAKLLFLATSQERPAAPVCVSLSLLSLLLRLIDRNANEETPNAGEGVVFNQVREKKNWKALEK